MRGDSEVIVEVRTLAGPKHSGEFGGPAPDALIVLLQALATLHDAHGDVAVSGLRRERWEGASYTEDDFQELAELEPGMPLFGTGNRGERLWSGPALTVVGPAYEAARAALRTAWGSDPVTMASGGSIPLVSALHEAVPDAEILLFGAEDSRSNLHAPNERVLLDELEKAVVAEAEFFQEYAARKERAR